MVDRLSPAALRDALVHAPIGIGLVDESGRFLMVSTALAELLGRREDAIIGRAFVSFVHPEERARSAAEYFEAITAVAAGARCGSTTLRCVTGERKSVLLDVGWAATQPDEAGTRLGVIYLAHHSSPVRAAATAPRGITAREAQVLELVTARYDNVDIATLLHISKRTVEAHVAALLRKFAVPNRRALRNAVARAGQRQGAGSRPV